MDHQRELDEQLYSAIFLNDEPWVDFELAESLIKRGANVNAKNEKGHPLIIEALLEIGEDQLRKDVTKFLLKLGADSNAKSADGDPALSLAIASSCPDEDSDDDYLEMLKSFLDHGASIFVDGNTESQKSVVETVLKAGTLRALRLLFKYGLTLEKCRRFYPLHCAAQHDNDDRTILEFLLVQKRFDIEEVDTDGETPLHVALQLRNINCLKILLAYKAKVNYTTDTMGATPLSIAIHEKDLDSMILLIDHGADVNMPGDLGGTPLITAVTENMTDVAEFLLANGAVTYVEPDEDEVDEETPTLNLFDFCLDDLDMLTCLHRHTVLRSIQKPNVQSDAQNSRPTDEMTEVEKSLQNSCRAELELMQTSVVYGTTTFYDFLTNKNIPTLYVKNEPVIQLLNSGSLTTEFPIYGVTLVNCFHEAHCKTDILDKATKILGEILDFDPHVFHPISRHIISYLDAKDLNALCLI